MKRVLCFLMILVFCITPVLAADHSTQVTDEDLEKVNVELSSFGKSIGIGLAVSGAAAGIGAMFAAAAEGIARNPEAAETIDSSMKTGVYACVGLAAGAIIAAYFL